MMIRPVKFECLSVDSMRPAGSAGCRSIEVEMAMTDAQVRQAVLALLGGMPPDDVLPWLQSEQPSLFGVPA